MTHADEAIVANIISRFEDEGTHAYVESTGGGCTAVRIEPDYPQEVYPFVLISEPDGGTTPTTENGMLVGLYADDDDEGFLVHVGPLDADRAVTVARAALNKDNHTLLLAQLQAATSAEGAALRSDDDLVERMTWSVLTELGHTFSSS